MSYEIRPPKSHVTLSILRIDNGDLGTMWLQWCVFSDILVIYYSI